jgi:hypothetical protein
MSQLVSSTANPFLTTYARGQGFAVDPVADIIAPVVVVGSPRGQYKDWSDKNSFVIPSARRAIGGPAARIEFAGTDGTYFCKPRSLEIGIDDEERGDGSLNIEEAKTAALLAQAGRARIEEVVDVAFGRAADATPAWSTPSSGTPISDLNAQIEAIAIATGQMPTDIIFGITAWRYFVAHNQVADRIKDGVVNPGSVTQANLLLAPGIRLHVSASARDTTKPGVTASKASKMAGNVLLFVRQDNPSLYDASWIKTFRTDRTGIGGVRMYRDERNRSDILALDWSEDIKITNSDGGRRLTVS